MAARATPTVFVRARVLPRPLGEISSGESHAPSGGPRVRSLRLDKQLHRVR